MVRRPLCLLFVFLTFSPSPAAILQQTDIGKTGTSSQEIPFEVVNGHLIEVRGSIGSRTNLPFLIEIGTPRTMVALEYSSNTEPGKFGEVLLTNFSLGSVPMPEVRAIAADLSQMPAVPGGVAGIVGLDVLQRQDLAIDYLEKKIFLSPRTGGEHQAPIAQNDAGLAIDANWKGEPLKLVLSTGVEAVALDQERVGQSSIKLNTLTKGSLGARGDASKELTDVFELRELTLSDVKLKGLGVLRKMDWPEGSDKLMGFLPLSALRARRVSLDFKRKRLFWDSAGTPTERARLAGNEGLSRRKP